MKFVHRNNESIKRDWPAGLIQGSVAFVSQDADQAAKANAALLDPVRYRTVPGIAYRLALVAAGEGDLAMSLNAPTGWDVAGGHALLIGAGGDLFDSAGARVTYDKAGVPENSSLARCFGGKTDLVSRYVHRSWEDVRVRRSSELAPASSLSFLEPGNVIDDPNLLSRAQGCLLGQFAGDALGSLVEFNSASEISRKYPTGPDRLTDGGTFSTIAGQPTDDSEMALALARSILAMGDYDRDDVAASYARWLESKPFDVGTTTSAALSAAVRALKAKGNPGTAALAAASRSSQANGALMRVSPLAIHSYAKGAEDTMALARADAELTHPHEVCQDANAVFAAAVAFAVRSGEAAEGVYQFALELASRGKISGPVLDRLTAARRGAPPEFEGSKMGWVLVAFQNAFYHLLHSASPEQAIIETVRSGGDTDTNAAITGALLGAVYGRDCIPQQWRRQIESCRPISGLPGVKRPRPALYWPVDVLNLAENLLVVGRSRK